MLQLQRASAGSGKTYKLAKTFIEYFISYKDDHGNRILRPVRGLRESLQHILAITFTNKATNEMKLRIVEKLNALATWTPEIPIKDVDYLHDFTKEFNCSPQEIAGHCKYALKVLLTDYGDFKVSTIDSFFQTVLRTFAYEADLDDTYQLELDSDYISQMGLDTTLDEIDSENKASQGTAWVESMMENKASLGKGWNIFQRNNSKFGVYREILNASKNLAKENFKEIRESLDTYFAENPDFFHTYHQLCNFYEKKTREAFEKMREAARSVRKAFSDAGLDMDATAGTYLASRVKNMANVWKWDQNVEKDATFKIPEFNRKGATTRVFHPKKENPHLGTPVEDHIEESVIKMYEYFDVWRNEVSSEKIKKWRIYRTTMPYVGLLQIVRNNSRLFLTDSNTVELAETNSILNRIIGDDDAPFVYERLGSRLEHFLIDEFQDTSNMQWRNLRPLLSESEGKGNDNLIIGDAKQSIYRFRNADPSLITEKVPRQFSETCTECGNSPAENTNWRSSLRIVRFNNLFFRFFSNELGPAMVRLYSNTVQPASHTDNIGYVKIQLFKNEKTDDDIPAHFDEIPELIANMLSRGYKMGEIAVLVDTHDQGTKVIDRIMLYNQREDIAKKINFISVDSLQAGESPAVQTVLSILEAISNGTHAKLNPIEEQKEKGAGDWSKLKADFSFFAMHHPETEFSELLSRFLDGEYNPDAISDMLAGMSTTVLPALIENIIREFIPDHTRKSEAAFLAALQDMVLEYCEGHVATIASFLHWWDNKGKYRSIASPEETDAVNIMTVHKSKGLEFRCVIVPYSKQTIKPMSALQREWLWVKPDLSDAAGIPQIPWIPIWSEPGLENSIHADIYRKYLDDYLSDKVNMAYVAYTRAIDELYIYSPCGFKEDGSTTDTQRIGYYLWKCATEADDIISDIKDKYPDVEEYLPSADEINVDSDSQSWSYGNPLTPDEIIKGRKKKEGKPLNVTVKEYRCGNLVSVLKYEDPSSPDSSLLPFVSENDEDPPLPEDIRRFGELMHAIMEQIKTAEDLPHALLKMKAGGFINRDEMQKLKEEISKALTSVKEYGWFDKGQRVINERGLLHKGKLRRPDRLLIRPDGTAVIVDYKFGEKRSDKYKRQIYNYKEAVENSGIAKKCEAYIWYVSLGEVDRI
ncbi:MAG: UvrD-helicase domain-containing protein [Muribaculaceae bacterium]|nr:UvrD-helicase domain-containing protein [Muribaculaceae bacterium]